MDTACLGSEDVREGACEPAAESALASTVSDGELDALVVAIAKRP